MSKNPDIDTTFLPDRERDQLERQDREELRKEWLLLQEEMKEEEIEITYSYYDGNGNRQMVTVRLSLLSSYCTRLTSMTVQERRYDSDLPREMSTTISRITFSLSR